MTETTEALEADLKMAIQVLRQTGAGFVIVKAQRVLAASHDHGVQSLLTVAERLRSDGTSGAVLADTVLGRAALLVAIWAGIHACHGEMMSEDAIREVRQRRLAISYSTAVPLILNRGRSGRCPFEAAAHGTRAPAEAVARLRAVATALAAGQEPDASSWPTRQDVYTRRWVVEAGLGLALAVTLPVGLHLIGLGPALLPMHLPVLLTAALSGAKAGFIVGALAPAVSHLATGMPPVVPPIALLMTVELATYGLTAGAVRMALRRRIGSRFGSRLSALVSEYAWLVVALITGRVTLGLAASLFGPTLGLQVPTRVYLQAAVLAGIPGLVVQLTLVPPLVMRTHALIRSYRGAQPATAANATLPWGTA